MFPSWRLLQTLELTKKVCNANGKKLRKIKQFMDLAIKSTDGHGPSYEMCRPAIAKEANCNIALPVFKLPYITGKTECFSFKTDELYG